VWDVLVTFCNETGAGENREPVRGAVIGVAGPSVRSWLLGPARPAAVGWGALSAGRFRFIATRR